MPTKPSFPARPFSEKLAAARKDIEEYFNFGREVAARVQRQLARQQRVKDSTASPDGKFKNAKGVIPQAAEEFGVKPAFVNQAKQCAQEFSAEWVEDFLAQCEEHEHVPTRQTFINLCSVPAADRPIYVRLILERNWSAKQIAQNRMRDFGKSSNGGKEPARPRSLAEAIEQLDRMVARIGAVQAAFTPEGVSGSRRGRMSLPVACLEDARLAVERAKVALAG